MINPGVVAAIGVVGVRGEPCGAMQRYCTTRFITYTYYTYCCHNTGIDHQDFKFSVF